MLDLPPHIAEKMSTMAEKMNAFNYSLLGKIEQIMKYEDGSGSEKKLQRTIFHEIRDDVGGKLPPHEKDPTRLMADASVIIGAGTETTARTLSVTTFYLLRHPYIGEKLRRELNTVLPTMDAHVSLPQLEALPYLVSSSFTFSHQMQLIDLLPSPL
jgi:hypothetical protein